MKIIKRIFLKNILKSIKLLVLDVDGVLTNGMLIYGEKGEVFKAFNVKDGLGIKLLQKEGIEVAFLSGGKGGAIDKRAEDLNVKYCLSGIKDKKKSLLKLLMDFSIKENQVAFVGDDLNDLNLKGSVGCLIATADAARDLKKNSDIVLSNKGGEGAIRELAEKILNAKGKLKSYKEKGLSDTNA